MTVNPKASSFSEFSEKFESPAYIIREVLNSTSNHSSELERNGGNPYHQRSASIANNFLDIQEPPGLSQTIAIQRNKLKTVEINQALPAKQVEQQVQIISLNSSSNQPAFNQKNSELSYVLGYSIHFK